MVITVSLDQIDFTCSMTMESFFFVSVEWVSCPVCYLKLAWSSILLKRLGCFGLAMEVEKGLRLEKGTQTKESQMERLVHADMFVQMRGIERKIKGII